MVTFKRLLFSISFLGAFVLPAAASAQAYEWEIRLFHADIVVNEDGSIDVTETIETHFNEFKHGIYRDIPVKYRNAYNQHIKIGLDVQSVTDENGQEYQYELSREGAYQRIKIGDPDRYANEDETYVIKYRAERGLRYSDDHDELYWNVTGNAWEVPIPQSSATIHLPFTTDSLETICFTGETGSTEQNCFSNIDGNTVAFGANDYLTVAVSWPKGLVAEPTAATKVGWFVSDNWGFVLPLFAAMGAYYVWSTRGRDPKGKGVVRQYEAPDKLSPAETGFLVGQSFKTDFVAAEIIALAESGYVNINEVPYDGRVTVRKTSLGGKTTETTISREQFVKDSAKQGGVLGKIGDTFMGMAEGMLDGQIEYQLERKSGTAPLKAHQKLLLESLFADAVDGKMLVEDLPSDFYKEVEKVKKSVWQSINEAGYFSGKPESMIGIWVAVAIVLCAGFFALAASHDLRLDLVIGGIVSAVILVFTAFQMSKRTEKGVAAYEYALGFKHYIEAAETERVKFQERENLFFEVLPFAMVFGIADKWAKAFEGKLTQPPEWYSGTGVHAFSALRFSDSISSFSSATASHSSPPSSSSSGFSGGSSGGGGGGGGGGSW